MGYLQTQNYINSLNTRGIVPGLDAETALLKQLGNPHHKLNFIHIAGTNGKGSVGAYLSEILCADNKSVARFVSPCVGEYKNTFLLNAKPVSEEIVTNATELVRNAMDKLKELDIYPTAFETEVALAFVIFTLIAPDYVLLECGMGGKNDATNVIPAPKLAVITKISMDHTDYLGDTLEKIAEEKAGIVKDGSHLVTIKENEAIIQSIMVGPREMIPTTIATTPEDIEFQEDETTFTIDGVKYTTKMLGAYQPQNAALAIECGKTLDIDTNTIKKGVGNTSWDYRFQTIDNFILDGAHNPDGAQALAESMALYCKGKKTAFICGCFKDKDYNSISKITSPFADIVYCIKAPTTRGLDPEILCSTFRSCGADAHVSLSLNDAINKCRNYDKVVIFGSLSILHEAKKIIERDTSDATLQ